MNIKFCFLKFWAALRHPRSWSRDKALVFMSDIQGLDGNKLQMNNCLVKKSKIEFSGNDNRIRIKGCDIFNCNIFLRGKGHSLIIEDDVRLHNMWIKIIGEGNTVHIGSKSTFGSGHIIAGGKKTTISIGGNCMIADDVDIWGTDTHSIYQNGNLVNPPASITIGDHVWIGKGVAILKGVTVGDNAVIGMRSLVTKDIAAGTLNVGSPAKEIRQDIDWNRWNPNNE